MKMTTEHFVGGFFSTIYHHRGVHGVKSPTAKENFIDNLLVSNYFKCNIELGYVL